jgi:hypothetical protein
MQDANTVTIFSYNDDIDVRTLVDKDGRPWFVGRDIAVVLGYTRPSDAVHDHCKNRKTVGDYYSNGCARTPSDTSNGNTVSQDELLDPKLNIIPEKVDEVLPNLRKYGTYSTGSPQHARYMPENYGYFSVGQMSGMIGASPLDINKHLLSRGYQEASIDKLGRMAFKLTRYGKEYGIMRDAVKVNGQLLPKQIYWRESVMRNIPVRLCKQEPKLIE